MGQLKDFEEKKVAIRVCPNCARAFYALGGDSVTCTFCGTSFVERRGGDRVRTKVRFLMNMMDHLVPAKVEDYSRNGVMLAYSGKPLDVDSIIDLDISELAIKVRARAVWSRALKGNVSYTGFTFIQQEKERFFAQ
jgi:ribosomal protein S27E